MKATFDAQLLSIDEWSKVNEDGTTEPREVTLTLVAEDGSKVMLKCDDKRTVGTLMKRLPERWKVTVESL